MLMNHKTTLLELRLMWLLLVHKVLCGPCNDGLYLSSGKCIHCPATCETCWSPTYCTHCKAGFYGDVCEFHCLLLCKDCNKITGRCPVQCPVGYYTDKQDSCQKCPEHCTECNTTYCVDCAVGYRGNLCQEQCINCRPGTGCHKKGFCLEDCKDGYSGQFCNNTCISACLSCERFDEHKCLSCLPGYYGQNCKSECNDACRENECDIHDGSCSLGCKVGFSGKFCDIQPYKQVALVAGITVGSLVLVLTITISVIIYRKRVNQMSQRNQPEEDPPRIVVYSKVPQMILARESRISVRESRISRHLNKHMDEDPEYDYPNQFIPRKDFDTIVANKTKEQYKAELKSLLDLSKRLYKAKRQTNFLEASLDASYIDNFDRLKAYIVCKAPSMLNRLAETFWRIVWKEKCQNIVLISATNEKAEDKIWPKLHKEPLVFGNINVTLSGELRSGTYETKELYVQLEGQNENITKPIHQFSVRANVPENPTSFVEFFDKYRKAIFSGDSPVLVCSSRISNCGIFIALDMMTRMLESTDQVSVVECLSHLLRQRLDLIQTVEEYLFLHEALVCFIKGGVYNGRRSYIQHQTTIKK